MNTRREFLTDTSLGLLGTAIVVNNQQQKPGAPPAGTPPAFGTGPAVGPEVTPATFAEAEKVVQVELSAPDRAKWPSSRRSRPTPIGIPFCRGRSAGRNAAALCAVLMTRGNCPRATRTSPLPASRNFPDGSRRKELPPSVLHTFIWKGSRNSIPNSAA